MHVERHVDPHAFLAAAAPLAAGSAPLFAFVHAWVDGVLRAGAIDRCFMAVAADEGFALQRDDGPVFLGACTAPAAAAFADEVCALVPSIDSVTGREDACLAFCARWTTLTGRVAKLRMRTRHHVLKRLVPPAASSGRMTPADDGDAEWLLAQLRAFSDEAGLRVGAPSLQRAVRERLDARTWRIWRVEGEPVAFAGFTVSGPRASRIGPVYTLPSHRHRGRAGSLVAALCDELTRVRPDVFLVTDASNPTSNALYRRLGFEPLDDDVVFDLDDAS
jgi:predicted GNAT family acetyltransferase